jgi:hypothetical protein
MWPICLAYTRSASRNCMIACDRARVATEFGFKIKWPMSLGYGRMASRNCMIACDRARVAIDLGLKGKAHVFRVCENCNSQYIIA